MTREALALAAALSASGCTVAVAWSVHRTLGVALAFLLAAAVLVASVLSPS